MKIPGYIMRDLLLVMMLGTITVLFIVLPTKPVVENTSEESTCGLIVNHQGKNVE